MHNLTVGRGAVSLIVAAVVYSTFCVGAQADGGFSGGPSSFGNALSNAWTTVVSEGATEHESRTFANATVNSLYGGHLIEGYANAGNLTNAYLEGEAIYNHHNKAKAQVYAKGGNVLAKARSQTYTTIVIDGVTYVVAEELARALARYTPLGTTAAAASESSISAQGSGYIGVNTGTKNEATVRIQN